MKAYTFYTKYLKGKGGGWSTKASVFGSVKDELHNGDLGHYYCKETLDESIEATMDLLDSCNIEHSDNIDLYYLDDVSELDNVIDECPKEYEEEFLEQRNRINGDY